MPTTTQTEEEYEVEAILDRRRDKNGQLEYLLKWKGYEEQTWEPFDSCSCTKMIEKYEKDRLRSPRPATTSSSLRSGANRGREDTPQGRLSRKGSSIVPGKKRAASESSGDDAPTSSKKTRKSRASNGNGRAKRGSSVSSEDDAPTSPKTERKSRASTARRRVVVDSSDSSNDSRTSSKKGGQSRVAPGSSKKCAGDRKKEVGLLAISPDPATPAGGRASRSSQRSTALRALLTRREQGEEISMDTIPPQYRSAWLRLCSETPLRASRSSQRSTASRALLTPRGQGEEGSEEREESEGGDAVAPRSAPSSRRQRDPSASSDDTARSTKSSGTASTTASTGRKSAKNQAAKSASKSNGGASSVASGAGGSESGAKTARGAQRRSGRRSTAAAAEVSDEEEETASTSSRTARPAAPVVARSLEDVLIAALVEHPYFGGPSLTGNRSPSEDYTHAPAKVLKAEDLQGMDVWMRHSYEEKFDLPSSIVADGVERFADRAVEKIIAFVKHPTVSYVLVKLAPKKNEHRPSIRDTVQGVHTHLAAMVMPKAFSDYSERLALLAGSPQFSFDGHVAYDPNRGSGSE